MAATAPGSGRTAEGELTASCGGSCAERGEAREEVEVVVRWLISWRAEVASQFRSSRVEAVELRSARQPGAAVPTMSIQTETLPS